METERYHPDRCPVCASRTLYKITDMMAEKMPDMTKEEIVANGGICPICRSKIHKREYASGLVTYQTHESPLHWQMVDEVSKTLQVEKPDEFSVIEKEGKLDDLQVDVLATVPDIYHTRIGEAYEIVVENDRDIKKKEEKR